MPSPATGDARRAGPDDTGPPPTAGPPAVLPMAYVLPLRWHADTGLDELTGYLRRLNGLVEVLVVDGSPPELFARHAAAWRGLVRHLRPDPAGRGLNGKVVGVHTGVGAARHEHVVIADDDVRYDEAGLHAVHRLLDRVDLVRPQNYFDPLPWHAWWDTGRTLLNRALGNDYPGTLAVRRSTFLAMGGYDPDVLFENLELIRTVRAYGGIEAAPPWLYVRRLPPDAAHFRGQRVRQAYDDLAQPARLLTALAVLPALTAAVASRRPRLLLGTTAIVVVALAEAGRRRAAGAAVFPPSTSLAAPLWLLERGICSWLALSQRLLLGGVRYGDTRIRRAAHPRLPAILHFLRGRKPRQLT
ncbi:glycosyltransferase [Micromonospora sp. DT4]|uniref:glycosyltransferase n=1 Tax=Micromonospora sp. DT4 TaxID=3393438 RepID=UPI003CED7A8B